MAGGEPVGGAEDASSGRSLVRVGVAVGGSGSEVSLSEEAVQFATPSVAVRPGSSVVFVESLGVPDFSYTADGTVDVPSWPILCQLPLHGPHRGYRCWPL